MGPIFQLNSKIVSPPGLSNWPGKIKSKKIATWNSNMHVCFIYTFSFCFQRQIITRANLPDLRTLKMMRYDAIAICFWIFQSVPISKRKCFKWHDTWSSLYVALIICASFKPFRVNCLNLIYFLSYFQVPREWGKLDEFSTSWSC